MVFNYTLKSCNPLRPGNNYSVYIDIEVKAGNGVQLPLGIMFMAYGIGLAALIAMGVAGGLYLRKKAKQEGGGLPSLSPPGSPSPTTRGKGGAAFALPSSVGKPAVDPASVGAVSPLVGAGTIPRTAGGASAPVTTPVPKKSARRAQTDWGSALTDGTVADTVEEGRAAVPSVNPLRSPRM